MDLEFIKALCGKINLPTKSTEKALCFLETEPKRLQKAVRRASYKNPAPYFRLLKSDKQDGAARVLAAMLLAAENAYTEYRKRGIPDEIYYDTMTDLSIWTRNAAREKGEIGIVNIAWVRHILYLQIFKIGRLQYQFGKINYSLLGLARSARKQVPIPKGCKILCLHIPEAGRLDLEACRASLREAKAFFKTYYPEFDYQGFFCGSWLLSLQNERFMDMNSNIMQFPQLFDLVLEGRTGENEMLARIWTNAPKHPTAEQLKDYPEDTDLRRRAKAYFLSGGEDLSDGYGFISV